MITSIWIKLVGYREMFVFVYNLLFGNYFIVFPRFVQKVYVATGPTWLLNHLMNRLLHTLFGQSAETYQ